MIGPLLGLFIPGFGEEEAAEETVTLFRAVSNAEYADIPFLVSQGGFQIEQIETGYLAPFPKSWTYCFWGTAIPR